MKTSSNGRALIERYEGLILKSYDDANDHIIPKGGQAQGTLTIGYGHTSAAGPPKVYAGQTITKQQADSILASDLGKVEADVNRLVKVPLTQNQFDALVSFHFNTGALGKSSLLIALNKRNYDLAANRFMVYTNGRIGGKLVPMAGLTRRRTEEKALFLAPDPDPVSHGITTVALAGSAGAITALYQPPASWCLFCKTNWFYIHQTEVAVAVALVILAIGTWMYYRDRSNYAG
jgi:lysozyme